MAENPKKDSRKPRDQEDPGKNSEHEEESLDLKQRDPRQQNGHIQLMFSELFAEPHPSVFSHDRVWTYSFQVFRTTRSFCYKATGLVCAVPASLVWGVYFALLSCFSVWCCRPCIRAFQIHMHCVREICTSLATSCLRPLADICGACCSCCRTVVQKTGGEEERFRATDERDMEEQGFVI